MDISEFPNSPPKRQRTDSPKPPVISDGASRLPALPQEHMTTEIKDDPDPGHGELQHGDAALPNENSILDTLMQHVESASADLWKSTGKETQQTEKEKPQDAIKSHKTKDGLEANSSTEVTTAAGVSPLPAVETHAPEANIEDRKNSEVADIDQPTTEQPVPIATNGASDENGTSTTIDGTAATSSLENGINHALAASGEVADGEGAEWEIDSSPIQSSSDSDVSSDTTSDDSDDDEDEDEDGDYAMLDPEEQARILMAGDGGSDDEGGRSKDKSDAAPLRTANERPEQIIPKPDITVTEDMQLEELGVVESVVESTVLVKAKVSGEYRVLESGSLLCLEDRTVIGVVAETLGRVEQPRYTIRFTNDAAIADAKVSNTGTKIYYVHQHSSFVFTQPLKSVKGSDASNFHDEEVGDDEMEFSDDEAEAEHKRQMKMKRQGRKDDGGSRGGRGRGNQQRGGRGSFAPRRQDDPNANAYNNGSMEISYDDAEGGLADGYTPLVRPENLHEMMGQRLPEENPNGETFASRRDIPPSDRGSFRGRGRHAGRGDRGNRGGRGGSYRGRGGFDRSSSGSDRRQSGANDFSSPVSAQYGGNFNQNQRQSPQYNNNNNNNHYPNVPPAGGHTYQFLSQPHPPGISPQPTYPPFSPSPISPLDRQPFNFGGYRPPPDQHHQQYQGGSQYHLPFPPQGLPQASMQMPPPGSYNNPTFMQNFQQQQQQQQQQSTQNGQNSYGNGGWGRNQAAAAQVQAQLEQMRKNNNLG